MMTGSLTFGDDDATFLIAAFGVGISGGPGRSTPLICDVGPPGEAGHGAWPLRSRQRRRCRRQARSPRHHDRLGPRDGRAGLGHRPRHHGRDLLSVRQGGPGPRPAPRGRPEARAAFGHDGAPEEHLGLAFFALPIRRLGRFVALALWMSRYLIGVDDLDIASAGMVDARSSIPASPSIIRLHTSEARSHRPPTSWRSCHQAPKAHQQISARHFMR